MRMLLLLALFCAPILYAQDDPVRLPAPKKGEAATKDGKDAFDEGRMKDAVAHFTGAIAAQEDNDELYAYRAAARVALGEIDEASDDIEKAVELESTFSLTWNTRGYIAWMRGEYDKAVENYNSAIVYALNDRRVDTGGLAQIYQNRGVAYQDHGNNDRALLDFNECIELVPDNPAFLENRGLVYVEKELFDVAFLDFDKAVELDKKNARAYVNRAYAARRMEDFEQAVRDYSQALRLRDDYGQALLGRGRTWMAWGQKSPAEKDFLAATELEGFEAAAWVGYGDIYRIGTPASDLETLIEAIEGYSNALKHHANYPPALRGLVEIGYATGHVEQATQRSGTLIFEETENPRNWFLYGKGQFLEGRYDRAVAILSYAAELDRESVEARVLLVRAFIAKGDYSIAVPKAQQIWVLDRATGHLEIARSYAVQLKQEGGESLPAKVIESLRNARERGANLTELQKDEDFSALSENAEFKKLVGAE